MTHGATTEDTFSIGHECSRELCRESREFGGIFLSGVFSDFLPKLLSP